LKKNIGRFSFILKFNEKESLFNSTNSIKNGGNKSINISRILTGANKIIYQNIQTKEKLLLRDAYGEKFIVKSNIDSINWILKNEEKIINGYKCSKAETFKITKNNRGIFKKPVIAWYCPSIPYNFGPKGYAGLPGMIIELTEGKFEYFATNIVLNKKEKIRIVKPSKGKLVTEEEFFQIGIRASQSWGKN
jgi:GLPGLI family protein